MIVGRCEYIPLRANAEEHDRLLFSFTVLDKTTFGDGIVTYFYQVVAQAQAQASSSVL